MVWWVGCVGRVFKWFTIARGPTEKCDSNVLRNYGLCNLAVLLTIILEINGVGGSDFILFIC